MHIDHERTRDPKSSCHGCPFVTIFCAEGINRPLMPAAPKLTDRQQYSNSDSSLTLARSREYPVLSLYSCFSKVLSGPLASSLDGSAIGFRYPLLIVIFRRALLLHHLITFVLRRQHVPQLPDFLLLRLLHPLRNRLVLPSRSRCRKLNARCQKLRLFLLGSARLHKIPIVLLTLHDHSHLPQPHYPGLKGDGTCVSLYCKRGSSAECGARRWLFRRR